MRMRPQSMVAPCDSVPRWTQRCGAVMRLRCDRRGRACGDVVLQSLPVWDLLGNAGQKCDDWKWECFATMILSFATGEPGGVLWEEEKKMNRRGEEMGQLRCGRGCGCETRENNSTLPKLARFGLGRSG